MRTHIISAEVYFSDAICPYRLTVEAVERMHAAGYLERHFPEGLNIHEEAFVDSGKAFPSAPGRTGRGIGGCKVVLHLRRRGVTVVSLAEKAGVGRSALTQILAGTPGRGGLTRRKIAPHLDAEELSLLGWDRTGKLVSPDCSTKNKCSTSANFNGEGSP